MRYCKRCVLPDTRPHLSLDRAGICIACRRHEGRRETDWDERANRFARLAESVKSLGREYDCVIPVSGGKDSTWQTAVCLNYGLKPLAVTWRSPSRTLIGQRNLDNLIHLGVDHIDYSINPDVERRFMAKTFAVAGSTAIPMHLAIFAIPLRVASAFNIPLVVWGENSAAEYGGREEDARSEILDSRWVHRYGVTQGTVAADWVGPDLLLSELAAYSPPSDPNPHGSPPRGVFLGYFFPWDPHEVKTQAATLGFAASETGPRTGLYTYADIDDDFISIHHWMKWYKFGFTRTFDNLSLEIRNGRVDRDYAIECIRLRGDETPWQDLRLLSEFLGWPVDRILKVAESFRSPLVWRQGSDGVWTIPDFLISDWDWTRLESRLEAP